VLLLCAGETVEGSIPGAADVMRQLGMPHELLGSHAALNKRWPLKTRPGTVGLWDPQAGSVLAAAALNAMQETARQRGWTFVEGQAVRSVQCSTGAGSGSGRSAEPPVAISLDSGRTLAAQRLVLSAGAWTSDMLALLGR
jgi:glycine/D-amino acid oxidase-like deaminating enzyme